MLERELVREPVRGAGKDRGVAAWEYNQERPHCSLGYRTPEEFAHGMGRENGCGKDGGFAPLETASGFPLSHSHGGDGISTASQVKGSDVVLRRVRSPGGRSKACGKVQTKRHYGRLEPLWQQCQYIAFRPGAYTIPLIFSYL